MQDAGWMQSPASKVAWVYFENWTVQAAPPPLGATVVQDSSDVKASRQEGNQQ